MRRVYLLYMVFRGFRKKMKPHVLYGYFFTVAKIRNVALFDVKAFNYSYKPFTNHFCFHTIAHYNSRVFINPNSNGSWIGSYHLRHPYKSFPVNKMSIDAYIL